MQLYHHLLLLLLLLLLLHLLWLPAAHLRGAMEPCISFWPGCCWDRGAMRSRPEVSSPGKPELGRMSWGCDCGNVCANVYSFIFTQGGARLTGKTFGQRGKSFSLFGNLFAPPPPLVEYNFAILNHFSVFPRNVQYFPPECEWKKRKSFWKTV